MKLLKIKNFRTDPNAEKDFCQIQQSKSKTQKQVVYVTDGLDRT